MADSVAGMRSLLVDIYPPSLQVGGLASALADLAKSGHGSEIRVDVEVDPDAAQALDSSAQQAVFRVAQETLRNAVKHSEPRRVELGLSVVPGGIRLEIADDGIGFDPDRAAAIGHFGLQSMADVSSAAGATLSVSSGSHGTRFRMEIPAT